MRINLFGIFRKYGNGEFVKIAIDGNHPISNIRALFVEKMIEIAPDFNEQAIVDSSAFAVNDEIVNDDYLVKENDILAILPPVCGG